MKKDHKAAAVTFLQMASSGRVQEAFSMFVGDKFRHHNAYFEGSANPLMVGMEENARHNPDKTLDIKHVIAEGDLVAIHSHVRFKPGDPGLAIVHIFRFDKDRIVELWDPGQQVPETSPNQYGMF